MPPHPTLHIRQSPAGKGKHAIRLTLRRSRCALRTATQHLGLGAPFPSSRSAIFIPFAPL
jgi:hypothetical protein